MKTSKTTKSSKFAELSNAAQTIDHLLMHTLLLDYVAASMANDGARLARVRKAVRLCSGAKLAIEALTA